MLIRLSKRVQTPRLNMTPMIDCVFLLLTFFMVASELARQYDAIQVQLPRIRASVDIPPGPHIVKVAADGTIYWGGEAVSFDRLAINLRWLHRDDPNAAVLLKADGRVEFRHIRAILKLCTDRHVKVYRLGFGVRPLEEASTGKEGLR